MAKAKAVIVGGAHTYQGYSFVVVAQGEGKDRCYWWHCGGCWQTCDQDPTTDFKDVQEEYIVHTMLCTGAPSSAEFTVGPSPVVGAPA